MDLIWLNQGAAVKIMNSETDELEAVYFQDNRMKKYYATFPDLLMFDGTYSLNDRRMPLIILLVIDGNGESQIAGFFIVKSENIRVLNFLFDEFKKENPNHEQTEVLLTDKSMAFRNVIATQFPNAVHHLCIFHVGQIFIREVTTKKRAINEEQRKTCLDILTNMIYADSPQRYDELYTELVNTQCQSKMFFICFFYFFIRIYLYY